MRVKEQEEAHVRGCTRCGKGEDVQARWIQESGDIGEGDKK